MEIDKTLFNAFNEFELDDLSFFNEVDRHYEQSEVTEATLNKRAMKPQEPIEETVFQRIEVDKLPTHYYLDAGNGLAQPSLVLLEQIRTIEHHRQATVVRLHRQTGRETYPRHQPRPGMEYVVTPKGGARV